MFEIPESIRPMRDRVLRFVEERIQPREHELDRPWSEALPVLEELSEAAKAAGLWALGHPKEIGGHGLPMRDYLFINEVVGRSEPAMAVLGTNTLQTALLLQRHATPWMRKELLLPMVERGYGVSFAVTEPGVASSDPTQLQTRAELVGDEWVISGRKWFISWVDRSRHVLVMCRTESSDVPVHEAFSMLVVPTDAPGFRIVRDLTVMGLQDVLSGHFELEFDEVRVPADQLLGPRGAGFTLAQDRLGPGRMYHCMRWLGMAQRAFDLLCRRANERETGGRPLLDRQLIQKMIFDSYCDIQAARLMVLHAAELIDRGEQARIEISAVKVRCAQMVHDVVDRAMQAYGGEGMTSDTPLQAMYRHARYGRIVDGPDEVHVQRVARRLGATYRRGETWDFATAASSGERAAIDDEHASRHEGGGS
jgi:alkylation response protein AidB-like acyl-CoA dehydrogenase